MVPKREAFPECEPATRRDLSALKKQAAESERAPEPAPRSSWSPRPQAKSATYSIVPGRVSSAPDDAQDDDGAAQSEVAIPSPPRPAQATPAMAKTWRLRLLVGRIGRVSPAELLEVPPAADWATINDKYRALVREFSALAYTSDDPGLRRRVALLLEGLAMAYEALAASHQRPVSATRAPSSRP